MSHKHDASPPRPKTASVKKLYELLKQVARDPDSVDSPLRGVLLKALTSQGALAALELPDLGIVGMALNTHKAIADAELSGRYEALNDYRKAAREKLKHAEEQAERPGRGTIAWYAGELAEKNAQLTRVGDDIALMSMRLDEVMKLAQHMAKEAGKEAEFNKRRLELLRRFKTS